MMKKNAIALAVAAVCASPLYAVAAGAAGAGHWEVATPSSPNESAPHLFFSRSHLGGAPATVAMHTETGTSVAEVATPLSVEESTFRRTAEDRRQPRAAARTRAVSLPNPQTPWSPNESGTNNYAQDARAYREHVASVEQTRVAVAAADAAAAAAALAAAEPATVDTASAAKIDQLLASSPGTPAPTERDRETVATVTPALVDSRLSTTSELRVDTPPADRPIPDAATSPSLPQEAERTAQSTPLPEQTGASTVAAASSSIGGSNVEVTTAAAPTAAVPAPSAAPLAASEMPTPAAATAESLQPAPAR